MTWMRLKNACEGPGQYGFNVPATDYVDEGVRLVRTTDLASGRLSPSEDGIFVPEPVPQSARLSEGDLLLSRSGTIGRAFLAPAEAEGMTFAGFLVRFRHRATVDPRYLFYATQSQSFQDQVQAGAVVSTIQNFNAERYANISIWCPSIGEQKRIADFLDAESGRAIRTMHLRREQLKAVAEREVSWLSEEYERLGRGNGLSAFRFGIANVTQGWSPQCEDRLPEDDEWGVLKAGCVNSGVWRSEQRKTLPRDVAARGDLAVRSGDLLVNRASGSLDLIGSAAVVGDVPEKTLLCDKLYRVTLRPDRLTAPFVAGLWRAKQVREHIKLGVSGAEGMANSLPGGVIKSVLLPYPTTAAQRLWTDRRLEVAQSSQNAREEMLAQIGLLQERTSSLITAAVTGEFDVSTASGRGA